MAPPSSRAITELSVLDRASPGSARKRRITAYYGAIVGVASMARGGETLVSALRCRRRPKRRPCGGFLSIRRQQVPPQIEWECSACRDSGVILGWEETGWDLSGIWGEPDDSRSSLRMPIELFDTLRKSPMLDSGALATLYRARHEDGHASIATDVDELEHLQERVAALLGEERSRRGRRRLERIFESIHLAMGGEPIHEQADSVLDFVMQSAASLRGADEED
jgi:hypothetical protein